jgi:hypothetical protein
MSTNIKLSPMVMLHRGIIGYRKGFNMVAQYNLM